MKSGVREGEAAEGVFSRNKTINEDERITERERG